MKGLDCLEDLKLWVKYTCGGSLSLYKSKVERIEKELKALEIIKKCPMFSLHDDLPKGTYRMYDCELYSHYDLTKEEYDLLKEALSC